MIQSLGAFLKDQSGATAIEYGAIAALVAVLVLPATSILGAGVSDALAGLSGALGPSDEPAIRLR